MTTATTASTAPGMQIIPGYECVEKIGAGGYGEVWKVRAPGGLLKALKLVYGHFDEDRATRELKAVNAMKEVRHPFILSVERVEVVEGRLAIVTELADGSLKDRFDECRRAGQAGIPRDELINYLRDAAEALDYLCKSHALQHLDVKPENLLLVAGRVKVADFGMVKSVQDPSVSQLNSLTPVYAPPEAFDGQPGAFSDQYSLSIVYHEMLTGVLPFSGKTTAQLAAQHIYGRPILVRLPVADQPAIQRALSKDPAQRFPNCRALIDVLSAAGTVNAPAVPNIPSFESPIVAPRNTEPRHTVPLSPTNSAPEPVSRARITPHRENADRGRLAELPPVANQANKQWARPTLFIGIGGTGGKALGQLRRKLRERFGDRTAIQALQMLYIDTNAKSLYEASQRDQLTALEPAQLLAVPLQPSQEYREDSRELLGWLNRRWLYNIPRSLQTEGIRPLGRLAYVDHAPQVWDRIRSALTGICDPNGITTSAAITGLPFAPAAPRVFVVASSTGGTGSGISLDIVFGLRRLLAEMNLSDEQLTLILAHSTDRRAGNRDIALANTYACLSELRHFSRVPFHDGLRAFDRVPSPPGVGIPNTYAIHMGDDLFDAQYATAVDTLADFLFRNSVTQAASYFDACRAAPAEAPSLEPTVRTFELRSIGATPALIASHAADDLCRTFVDTWRGVADAQERFAPLASAATELLRETQKRSTNDEAQVHAMAQSQADSWQITHVGVTEIVHGIVRRGIRNDVNRWIRESIVRSAEITPALTSAKLLEAPFNELAVSVEPYLQRLTESLSENVTAWFEEVMSTHESRVRGARVAAEWFTEHLRNVRQRLLAPLAQIETRLTTLTPSLQTLPPDKLRKLMLREPTPGVELPEESPEGQINAFVRLMTEGLMCRAGASIIAGIQNAVRSYADLFTDLRRDLSQLSESFQGDTLAKTAHPNGMSWYDTQPELARHLTQQLKPICAEIEKTIEQEFFGAPGELRRATKLDPEMRKRLPASLRSIARTIVVRQQKAQVGAQLMSSRLGGDEEHPLKIAAGSINARWLHCGGVRRLVVLPESQRPNETIAECEAAVGGACTVLFDPTAQPALCIEGADIPLRQILDEVSEGRNDIAQVAERLHTRIDVEWSR
ncbi:MAG: protein kinase [Planctomycetaceae bacterium]|nr:protein kinase [Planctomycetaceae bacterium]